MNPDREKQSKIHRMVTESLIAIIPETWGGADMNVARIEDDGKETFAISIFDPTSGGGSIEPTADIYDAIFSLSDIFDATDRKWNSVCYRVRLRADGNWVFDMEFNYL